MGNAAKGDGSLFVSAAELTEAWRIFTPLLHEIENIKPDVVLYPFGSHFPPGFDLWSEKNANVVQDADVWKEYWATHPQEVNDLMAEFKKLATDKGEQKVVEAIPMLKKLAERLSFSDVSDKKLGQIAANIPIDADGHIDEDAYLRSAAALKRAFGTCQTKIDHSQWQVSADTMRSKRRMTV